MKKARIRLEVANDLKRGMIMILRSVRNMISEMCTIEYRSRKIPVAVIMLVLLKDWVSLFFRLILMAVYFGNIIWVISKPTIAVVNSHQEKEFPKIRGGKGIIEATKKVGRKSNKPNVPHMMKICQSFRFPFGAVSPFFSEGK